MGINGMNGISGMQNYSIQMPSDAKQPVKQVITEEAGWESQVASSTQIDTGKAGQTDSGTDGEDFRQCGTGRYFHYVSQAG